MESDSRWKCYRDVRRKKGGGPEGTYYGAEEGVRGDGKNGGGGGGRCVSGVDGGWVKRYGVGPVEDLVLENETLLLEVGVEAVFGTSRATLPHSEDGRGRDRSTSARPGSGPRKSVGSTDLRAETRFGGE